MSLIKFLESQVEVQERIAPRSERITKLNHFVSQFIQKGWSASEKGVYAIYKDKGQVAENIPTKSLMAENYLYTVKELSNPNLFEKLRCLMEAPLVEALNAFEETKRIDDGLASSMLALMLCSSPTMVKQYENNVAKYIANAEPPVNVEDWAVRAMACGLMNHQITVVTEYISREYTFRVVETEGGLILSDYPVIQILDGEVIHREVGYYQKADQLIMPIKPNFYLEAIRKSSNSGYFRSLQSQSVNDLSLKTANNVIIGDSYETLVKAVGLRKLGDICHARIPVERQHLITGFGMMSEVLLLQNGEVKLSPIWSSAVTWPEIYDADDLIIVPYDQNPSEWCTAAGCNNPELKEALVER